jgi:cytochrome c-type biogenesis protein CcmH/NrfG
MIMAKESKNGKQLVRSFVHRIVVVTGLVCLLVGFILGFFIRNLPSGSKKTIRQYTVKEEKDPDISQENQQLLDKILILEKKLSNDPKNADAWATLGHLYFDSQQMQNAINAYKRHLELKPDNADVWTDMGIMYRRSGNPQEALNCFNQAIKKNPKHEQSRYNKGIVLMHDLNKVEEAIKSWDELVKINPAAKTPKGQPVSQLIQRFRARIDR